MRTQARLRAVLVLLMTMLAALVLAACGDDDDGDDAGSGDESAETSGTAIEENPDNNGVQLTIGSKNFTEQIILGEIYAQGLEAAGYDVSTDLNLGSEQVALRALESGDVSGYPEYTSTALTAFFDVAPEDVPGDPQEAFEQSEGDFAELGLTAYPPTPFSSANAVGVLSSTAEELGLTSISDLEENQDLTLSGSTECRQRIDCLAGLEQYYGLDGLRENFRPVDIGLRYEVLDNEDADLSILFTTDAQLSTSDDYTLLEDDMSVLPAGNVLFVASEEAAAEAGPDFGATIETVQEGLSLEVMQELNARVDVDREEEADVAADYLSEFGYVE